MTEFREVRIDLIDPSPFETRERFDSLESIESMGVLQPLLIRRKGERFEVICGHRRLETLRRLGREKAECKIEQLNDEQAARALYLDNGDRQDFADFEKGLFFSRYMNHFKIGQREAGRRLGISHTTISLCQAIVQAREKVVVRTTTQDFSLYAEAVTANKFKAANSLPEDQRDQVLQQAIEEKLSTDETRSVVALVENGHTVEEASTEVVNLRETMKPLLFQAARAGTSCRICGKVTLVHNEDGTHELFSYEVTKLQ